MSAEIKPIKIKINELFKDDSYIIPIYQRKFAWTNREIEQLLEDICHNNGEYYLGTLIVDKKENGKYEVIDGQQRLTALYLLMKYLSTDKALKKGLGEASQEGFKAIKPLEFEARKKYSVLSSLGEKDEDNKKALDEVDELLRGYKCISDYFDTPDKNEKETKLDKFCKQLKDKNKETIIVRVQVPEGIDLNHYFEIMNTRGEQLELHHIAKAKFLSAITHKGKKNKEDGEIASLIWDRCAKMDTHIQKNFVTAIREKIFSSTGDLFQAPETSFKPEQWEDLVKRIEKAKKTTEKQEGATTEAEDIGTDPRPLKDILSSKVDKYLHNEEEKRAKNKNKNNGDEENPRFESIIKFPYFLLHVNAVMSKSESEAGTMDDKKLLISLERHWENEENAKRFIYYMLYCRVLFDKYVVKREFKSDDDSEMSLEYYCNSEQNNQKGLRVTFGATDTQKASDNERERLIALQSILRITYTSPESMGWITDLLIYLASKKNFEDINIKGVTDRLEKYCVDKIKGVYKGKNVAEVQFPKIAHIVFTYLDYLLCRDGYEEEGKVVLRPSWDWNFSFRNSREHFLSQSKGRDDEKWKDDLDSFGNLALISISDNSKFSNLDPKTKATDSRSENARKQSPKFKIMAGIAEKEGWTPGDNGNVRKHQEAMFGILEKELNKFNNQPLGLCDLVESESE